MPKLSIDGYKIGYDIVDCANKLVIIKIPYYYYANDIENTANKICKIIKEKCNAKTVIAVLDGVDFETMNINEAIYKIDEYINELHRIREELLEDEDNA